MSLCEFSFICAKRWTDLQPTTRDDARYCGDCQQNVFYVPDEEQQCLAVALKRCGALYRGDWDIVAGNLFAPGFREFLVIGVRTIADLTDERVTALRPSFPAIFDRGENEERLRSGGLALLDVLEAASIHLLDQELKEYAPELVLDAPDDDSRAQLMKVLTGDCGVITFAEQLDLELGDEN